MLSNGFWNSPLAFSMEPYNFCEDLLNKVGVLICTGGVSFIFETDRKSRFLLMGVAWDWGEFSGQFKNGFTFGAERSLLFGKNVAVPKSKFLDLILFLIFFLLLKATRLLIEFWIFYLLFWNLVELSKFFFWTCPAWFS